ncbi:MAG: homocitrate synthase/isopropylmalate synthase family protein [Desulfohalobiaceae bacterium]
MLIDSTLREGAQAYGVSFSLQDCLRILEMLAPTGVGEIEIGWAGKQDLPALLQQAQKLPLLPPLSLWCRMKAEDLLWAARLGISRVTIGIPASSRHSSARLGRRPEAVLESVGSIIQVGRDLGLELICIGLEDASRAELKQLISLTRKAAAAGADRIRIADTVGLLTPSRTTVLVSEVSNIFPGEVAVHCHNDLGMATANAVSALESGAAWADVSTLGLGERCGIARLEEVAAYLCLGQNLEKFQLPRIRELCQEVAAMVGINIPGQKPVCGPDIFAAESGLHVQGLMQDPALFEPFSPEQIGVSQSERRLGWGEKSGRAAIRGALQRLQPECAYDEEAVRQTAAWVREYARRLGRPLCHEELAGLMRQRPPRPHSE